MACTEGLTIITTTIIHMKTLISLLFFAVMAAFTPQGTGVEEYAGIYKIKDGPLSTVTVSTESGKLFAEVDSYGKNEILKQDKADTFKSTSSYGTVYTFQRNADKKVVSVKIALMEQELVAEKEIK